MDENIPYLVEKYRSGVLPFEKLVTQAFPFSSINSAMEMIDVWKAWEGDVEYDLIISGWPGIGFRNRTQSDRKGID